MEKLLAVWCVFLESSEKIQVLAKDFSSSMPNLECVARNKPYQVKLSLGQTISTRTVGNKGTVNAPDYFQPLTERERMVLGLLAVGKSYQAVAQELTVALSTVQWHVKNIYQKLDVHNKSEATARAFQLRLIPLDVLD